MRQQREGAIRQVLRSLQVSLAALFCGQREDRVARPGLFFPRPFFRPAAARRSPHLWPLMRTFGGQATHVATQPGAFTLRVPRVRAVAAKTLATAHLSRGQRRSARGEPWCILQSYTDRRRGQVGRIYSVREYPHEPASQGGGSLHDSPCMNGDAK
jgi:hypothetical protein